jgi:hypothetical protein
MANSRLLAAILMVAAQAVQPEATKDARAAAPAAPAMEVPKPPPELDQLKPLEGTWNCHGSLPAGAMGPGSPAQTFNAKMSMKKGLDGFWYVMDYAERKSKTHPIAIKAHGTMGYDTLNKKFIMIGADNLGGWMTETGTGWDGDQFVFTGEGVMMGQKAASRDTIASTGAGEFTWTTEMKMGGAPDFQPGGVSTCRRASAK